MLVIGNVIACDADGRANTILAKRSFACVKFLYYCAVTTPGLLLRTCLFYLLLNTYRYGFSLLHRYIAQSPTGGAFPLPLHCVLTYFFFDLLRDLTLVLLWFYLLVLLWFYCVISTCGFTFWLMFVLVQFLCKCFLCCCLLNGYLANAILADEVYFLTMGN